MMLAIGCIINFLIVIITFLICVWRILRVLHHLDDSDVFRRTISLNLLLLSTNWTVMSPMKCIFVPAAAWIKKVDSQSNNKYDLNLASIEVMHRIYSVLNVRNDFTLQHTKTVAGIWRLGKLNSRMFVWTKRQFVTDEFLKQTWKCIDKNALQFHLFHAFTHFDWP